MAQVIKTQTWGEKKVFFFAIPYLTHTSFSLKKKESYKKI
jgi:hypothetical protein